MNGVFKWWASMFHHTWHDMSTTRTGHHDTESLNDEHRCSITHDTTWALPEPDTTTPSQNQPETRLIPPFLLVQFKLIPCWLRSMMWVYRYWAGWRRAEVHRSGIHLKLRWTQVTGGFMEWTMDTSDRWIYRTYFAIVNKQRWLWDRWSTQQYWHSNY